MARDAGPVVHVRHMSRENLTRRYVRGSMATLSELRHASAWRSRDRKMCEQLLHWDLARGGPSWPGTRDARHRRTDNQSLRFQTARMAGNLGFITWVVADATATFDRTGPDGAAHSAEQIQSVALSDIHGEFAFVIDTRTAIAAMRTHDSPAADQQLDSSCEQA